MFLRDGRRASSSQKMGQWRVGQNSWLGDGWTRRLSLDARLDAMKPETFHDDVEFGAPVGNEI